MESNTGDLTTILANQDNGSDGMGYLIEEKNKEIYVTFWVFDEDDKELIRTIRYYSLEYLYKKSKEYVETALIDYSLLHKSKYKMSREFITFYESEMSKV